MHTGNGSSMTTTAEHAASDLAHPRHSIRLTILGRREGASGPDGQIAETLGTRARTKLHRHPQFDELIRVADGELTIRAGRHMAVLRAGGQVTVPAGIAHALAETGPGASYSLVISPMSATSSVRPAEIAIVVPRAT